MTATDLLSAIDDRAINARRLCDRALFRAAACLIRRLMDPDHAEFCRVGEERL